MHLHPCEICSKISNTVILLMTINTLMLAIRINAHMVTLQKIRNRMHLLPTCTKLTIIYAMIEQLIIIISTHEATAKTNSYNTNLYEKQTHHSRVQVKLITQHTRKLQQCKTSMSQAMHRETKAKKFSKCRNRQMTNLLFVLVSTEHHSNYGSVKCYNLKHVVWP